MLAPIAGGMLAMRSGDMRFPFWLGAAFMLLALVSFEFFSVRARKKQRPAD